MEKIKVGISIGDINGIGLEVILKTLEDERINKLCTPIIYGSSKVVSYHKNITQTHGFTYNNIRSIDQVKADEVNIINVWNDNVNIKLGKLNESGGKYAFRSLEAATNALKAGEIDALVTAPINKKAMQMVGFQFPGHTEYLTKSFNVEESLMLMVNDSLRVGLVTNHLALKDVCANVTIDRIIEKIQIMEETLRIDFGITKPKIAVLALNPHAGDDGLMGMEETDIIIPALDAVKDEDILALGPYPADGFFGSGQYSQFDGILAMYHDQGLVPFKALSFGAGVNYTAGLPVVRTSPDHGTAYDIAGQNKADASSFRQALFVAIDVVKNRKVYIEMHANTLERQDEKALQQKLKEEEAKIREEEKHSKRYNKHHKQSNKPSKGDHSRKSNDPKSTNSQNNQHKQKHSQKGNAKQHHKPKQQHQHPQKTKPKPNQQGNKQHHKPKNKPSQQQPKQHQKQGGEQQSKPPVVKQEPPKSNDKNEE